MPGKEQKLSQLRSTFNQIKAITGRELQNFVLGGQSLDLNEVLQAPLPLQVIDEVRVAGDSLLGVVVCKDDREGWKDEAEEILTASHLKLTSLSIERIIVKIHSAWDCYPDTANKSHNSEMNMLLSYPNS